MGFLDSIFSSIQNFGLEQYGIKRPSDAVDFMNRLIRSRRDDEDKAKYAKFVITWLNRLSLSNEGSMSSEADRALDRLRNSYEINSFCERNSIRL